MSNVPFQRANLRAAAESVKTDNLRQPGRPNHHPLLAEADFVHGCAGATAGRRAGVVFFKDALTQLNGLIG
jgi:hypothetical protein